MERFGGGKRLAGANEKNAWPLKIYNMLRNEFRMLRQEGLKFLVKRIKSKILLSVIPHGLRRPNTALANITPKADFAVVLHVFHTDVLDEILEALQGIENPFDLFVTTPLEGSDPALKRIRTFYPNTYMRACANRGRDVGPFLALLPELQAYPACCKLHTKKGHTDYGDTWRKVCLESLFASQEQVDSLLAAFQEDPCLLLAGPELMYKSGPALMLGNEKRLLNLARQLGIPLQGASEWGFFAGTMFWFRPYLMTPFLQRYWHPGFTKEQGAMDGGLEHVLERVFGLLATVEKGRVALLRTASAGGGMRIVDAPGNPDSNLPSETLRIYHEAGKS